MVVHVKMLEHMYSCFNARDIDGVLIQLTDDVAWANGMEGGYVHGRESVREYWTRQWEMINPHVEPVSFHHSPDGAVTVTVRQTILNLDGKALPEQAQGLKNKTVSHVFRFRMGKVAQFDIADNA